MSPEEAEEVARVRGILLARLLHAGDPYLDGDAWVTGRDLADRVARLIVVSRPRGTAPAPGPRDPARGREGRP